jgi:1-acyl-sn-glycerol-3-phosphate acyltransferase
MSDFDSPIRRGVEKLILAGLSPWGVRVSGRERVPTSGPLIFAFNHASLLDGPLVGAVMGGARRPYFIGKKEIFAFPPIGWFLLQCGGIKLDRKSADHAAMRAALDALARGGSVALSPEGTRMKGGERRPPKLGVSFLAAKSGARTVPVRLIGTGEFPRRSPLEVRVGSPIDPPPEGREAASSFANALMDAIYSL